jgi:hypothetical protein
MALINGMNVSHTFAGTIHNRDNIGKTGDELVAQWNAENPNDPVEKESKRSEALRLALFYYYIARSIKILCKTVRVVQY